MECGFILGGLIGNRDIQPPLSHGRLDTESEGAIIHPELVSVVLDVLSLRLIAE